MCVCLFSALSRKVGALQISIIIIIILLLVGLNTWVNRKLPVYRTSSHLDHICLCANPHQLFRYLSRTYTFPNKHTGSDPEGFWLRPVMAITASVQPESGRIVYAGSDFPHPFQLGFSKEGVDRIVQNRPGSDLDGLVRVWPNASSPEASWCVGIIGPTSWFRSSTDVPDNTVQNQPISDLVLADCVRFWPNGSGPEASRCARIIRPASGQCFPADPDRMRIGSGTFTGLIWINLSHINRASTCTKNITWEQL